MFGAKKTQSLPSNNNLLMAVCAQHERNRRDAMVHDPSCVHFCCQVSFFHSTQ